MSQSPWRVWRKHRHPTQKWMVCGPSYSKSSGMLNNLIGRCCFVYCLTSWHYFCCLWFNCVFFDVELVCWIFNVKKNHVEEVSASLARWYEPWHLARVVDPGRSECANPSSRSTWLGGFAAPSLQAPQQDDSNMRMTNTEKKRIQWWFHMHMTSHIIIYII